MAFAVILFYGYFTISFFLFFSFFIRFVLSLSLLWFAVSLILSTSLSMRWKARFAWNRRLSYFHRHIKNVDFVPLCFYFMCHSLFLFTFSLQMWERMRHFTHRRLWMLLLLVILADIFSMSLNKNKSILLQHDRCEMHSVQRNRPFTVASSLGFAFFSFYIRLFVFIGEKTHLFQRFVLCIETSIFAISALNENAHSHARLHTREKGKPRQFTGSGGFYFRTSRTSCHFINIK